MRLGLLADVRGDLSALEVALSALAAAAAGRVACLGSTAEGGGDDEAVLARLRAVDALVVRSPHDAPAVAAGLPESLAAAGFDLAHAAGVVADEIGWLAGAPWPSRRTLAAALASDSRRLAAADLYAPVVQVGAHRRTFLRTETVRLPAGAACLACPGSVAMAAAGSRAGAVMVWDDETGAMDVMTLGPSGPRHEAAARPLLLAYGVDLDERLPPVEVLGRVEWRQRETADDIVAEIVDLAPDAVLLDYHLGGRLSGLDALLALRPGGRPLPVPIFTIASNPADNLSMKDAGAHGGLPPSFLADALVRLIDEIAPGEPWE